MNGIPAEDSLSEEEFSSETEDGSFSDTKTNDSHPLPSKESILTTLTESKWNWFQFLELMEKYNTGGPCVSYLPLPIPDPERPWGKADCNDCGGQCYGHFLKPEQALGSTLSAMRHPPSTLLKEFHQSLKGASPTQTQLLEISKKCLLPINEVEMWLEHLTTIAANQIKARCC